MSSSVVGPSLRNILNFQQAEESTKGVNRVFRAGGKTGFRVSGNIGFDQAMTMADARRAFPALKELRRRDIKVTFERVESGPSGIAHTDPFHHYKYTVRQGTESINPALCLATIARHAKTFDVRRPGVGHGGVGTNNVFQLISVVDKGKPFSMPVYQPEDILACPPSEPGVAATPAEPKTPQQLMLQQEQQERARFFDGIKAASRPLYDRLNTSGGMIVNVKFSDSDMDSVIISAGNHQITADVEHLQGSIFNILLSDVPHANGVWRNVQNVMPLRLIIETDQSSGLQQIALHHATNVAHLQKVLDPNANIQTQGRTPWANRAAYIAQADAERKNQAPLA